MKRSRQKEIEIAIHEVGHYLCADFVGWYGQYVSIGAFIYEGQNAKGVFGAGPVPEHHYSLDPMEVIKKDVIVKMGGLAAEAVLFRKQPAEIYSECMGGSRYDIEQVHKILSPLMSVEQMQSTMSECITIAYNHVSRNWLKAGKIAAALIAKEEVNGWKTLTAAEINETI